MTDELSHPEENDELKAENEFIKMKLMLEYGAKFGGDNKEELSPEMENEFLNNILEFEKQYDQHKMIKVFDKIGKPQHFKPANEIPESEIEEAWKELCGYLGKHEIYLDACSPNIKARELYRFTIEELFQHEIDDMDIPGMSTCFIYDEFHPDPVYESQKAVTEDLLPGLFKIEPVNDHFLCLYPENITINGKLYAESKDVRAAFNQFKTLFSSIDLQQAIVEQCNVIEPGKVVVTGNYKAIATVIANDEISLNGVFIVELQPDELGYWGIKMLQIESVNFLQ